MSTEPTVIRIEIERDGLTVRGVAAAPGLPAADFSGWVGLMAAIESLLDAADAPVPTRPHTRQESQ